MKKAYVLEKQATDFLKEHGFKDNGEPYSDKGKTQNDFVDDSLEAFFKEILKERKESAKLSVEPFINQAMSGSFTNKKVNLEDLIYISFADLKNDFDLGSGKSSIAWRLRNLIVPRFMWSGYGIYHFQFVPKEGLFMAVYKLAENDDYVSCFYEKMGDLGYTEKDIKKTCKMYDVQIIEQELIPGKRYMDSSKKPTKEDSKRLKKYVNRLIKQFSKHD